MKMVKSLRAALAKWAPAFLATDVDDMDNEKREIREVDVAGLHCFYSKHLEIPDHKDLLTLFSQVLHKLCLSSKQRFPVFQCWQETAIQIWYDKN